jgi:hypothetical protein
MLAQPATVHQFPVSSSPAHEPTTRHHTPDAPKRDRPSRHDPTKPKEPSRPKSSKSTGSTSRKPSTHRRGHRKSAPAGILETPPVGGTDLTHIPTLGTLPATHRRH